MASHVVGAASTSSAPRVVTPPRPLNVEMTDVSSNGHDIELEQELESSPLLSGKKIRVSTTPGGFSLSPSGFKTGDTHNSGAGGRRDSKWDKEDLKRQTWRAYLRASLGELFFGSYLNVLLIFCPLASLSVHVLHLSPGWIFGFSLLALMPLAERLGYVTEQLALYTGPTLGGLLNATFGNATEIIIAILALHNKPPLIRVVQMSLLGSILSNMLLVLGASFLAGGLRFREQKFNKAAAMVNSGLLLMAVMGLMFPAVLQATHTERNGENSELLLSRFSSFIMLIAYCCYLFFQLKTHSHLYDELPAEVTGDEGEENEKEREEEEEEAVLGRWGAVFWLALIALEIALLSEYLVDAIQGAAESWGLPVPFISVIILPIVGNAAEHASSIMFALKDKVDISLGVAIGSSTQIAMFAIPFCVVYAMIIGVPLDLDFKLFETACLFITVLVVAALLQEGECNYFKGIMLVLSYLIVAASFYVHSDNDDSSSDSFAITTITASPPISALLAPQSSTP